MTQVNRALTWLFDALLAPLDRLPASAGLAVLSLVTALAVLLAFKWTADQRALAAAKRAMQAGIFEMRLFNDDPAALFRAQGAVLRRTLRYLRLSLTPSLWLIAPLLLLMLHMEFRFGYTGLAIGEPVLLEVQFAAGAEMPASATLEAADAIAVETPAVLLPSEREIAWRIRPRAAGSYPVRVHVNGVVLDKTLLVSDAVARRSPVRPDARRLHQLVYPSEAPLPTGSGVAAIRLPYPERPFHVAGWDVGWSGVYLALTFVLAFALKGPFGVVL